MNDALREIIKNLPLTPGVYLFKNREGAAIYIGKALVIKKRVMSHFRKREESFSKEGKMLDETRAIDYIQTSTEAEALLLEASLVKERQPKYNQDLKDDKSFPFLKISGERFPRLMIVRERKADGSKYFGPYTNGKLLRRAVNLLRQLFPLRTCSPIPKKVCLMYHIGQCKGPCVGQIHEAEYNLIVKELELFLDGRRDVLVKSLLRRMKEHSKKREYEQAKLIYDEIKALSTLPKDAQSRKIGVNVLNELMDSLMLPRLPIRIEGFDISNIQGREAVGSMVVALNGQAARSQYRRFRIKSVQGIDDYEMMREVIRRRYTRLLEEKAVFPDLVMIDGGKGHLAAAKGELDALGLKDLPILSIAKQHEYIFTPDQAAPHIFPLDSPILQLIQRLRDEAHRFAISYHRRLHKKEAMKSILDDIPGIGPKTRERLLKKFGSISKIRGLTEIELVKKAPLSQKVASKLVEVLGRSAT